MLVAMKGGTHNKTTIDLFFREERERKSTKNLLRKPQKNIQASEI